MTSRAWLTAPVTLGRGPVESHRNRSGIPACDTARRQHMQHTQYISTRGQMTPAGFTDVLLAGLAPDGGLAVPDRLP